MQLSPLKKEPEVILCTHRRIVHIDKKRQWACPDKIGVRMLTDVEDRHKFEWILIEIKNSSEKGGQFYV